MSLYDFTGVTPWSQIQGWFDLPKAIAVQKQVKRLRPRSTLVELGSFQGRSSIAIAAVMPPQSTLHCVDHFHGSEEHAEMDTSDMFARFRENIEKFGVADRIEVLAKTTLEAADEFQPNSIDFILLDASHDYESVKADLAAWYGKLRAGGVLFCDDYDPRWPGVMQAVDETKLSGKVVTRALWMHQK